VLELTRRVSGWSLPILAGVFIAYAFLGPYLPGILQHRGYSKERFFTYIYGLDGISSVPIDISSKYIIIFIIFSAFLQVSGVGKYFVEWALPAILYFASTYFIFDKEASKLNLLGVSKE
jgi:TRAP-type uncharacterized transport system fused permease subunit